MDEYSLGVEKLNSKLQKGKPKRKRLRKTMKETFPGRRKWIREICLSIQDILSNFPLLKKSEYVSLILHINP